MESSSYFGFGRKPGFKGNSIYYTIDEEFISSDVTTGPINQIYKDEIMESNDKNATKHLLSMYATPTLNNIRSIIDDDNGMDNSIYPQQANNTTITEDTDSKIMPSKQMQMPSAESIYIDMPNLYNCINTSNGHKQYYDIKEFDNINEEFLEFNKSNKTEEKDVIPAKKEKFPDFYISKIDTATAKSTSGTMIASDKQYIESHYNVDDLCQWNVY
uniref:Uncharacterized protein n=1 Tax=Onchocerca volvulus TaxID=6282 RepID=A0A8R1TJD0_ONCVO